MSARADIATTAPGIDASAWLNVDAPLSLPALRGRVVLLHAFQMLCPGCVGHGLPQATAVHEQFGRHGVAVIGLHTVFEHHAVMGADALAAFVHEHRLRFPIAIDRADAHGPVPVTMRRYGLRGTPSLVLVDRAGHVRLSHFGRIPDLALGAAIGRLLEESVAVSDTPPLDGACTADACAMQ